MRYPQPQKTAGTFSPLEMRGFVSLTPLIFVRLLPEVQVALLSLRWASPAGATLPSLATAWTTCCTGHLFALPLQRQFLLQASGARGDPKGMLPHGSPRARRVSPLLLSHPPVTMRAHRHKAPLCLTACDNPKGFCLYRTRKGAARQGTSRCPRSSIAAMLAPSEVFHQPFPLPLLRLTRHVRHGRFSGPARPVGAIPTRFSASAMAARVAGPIVPSASPMA